MTSVTLIGCGRLGYLLAQLISGLPSYELTQGISSQSTKTLSKLNGIPIMASLSETLPTDLVLFCTPDDAISEAAQEYRETHDHATLIHCSGSLPARILNPSNNPNFTVGSLHPLLCATTTASARKLFAGSHCALEGDESVVEELQNLALSLGMVPFVINSDKKALYHAGCVLSANYIVTLAKLSQDSFEECGLEQKMAKSITESLMESALTNLEHCENHSQALTGPIARGDSRTIKAHLEKLPSNRKKAYARMAKETLHLAPLPPDIKRTIEKTLDATLRE